MSCALKIMESSCMREIGYANALVNDAVHVQIEVVDLRKRLLADHVLYHRVTLRQPASIKLYHE